MHIIHWLQDKKIISLVGGEVKAPQGVAWDIVSHADVRYRATTGRKYPGVLKDLVAKTTHDSYTPVAGVILGADWGPTGGWSWVR